MRSFLIWAIAFAVFAGGLVLAAKVSVVPGIVVAVIGGAIAAWHAPGGGAVTSD